MSLKILCIDFDGVIHDYKRGWQNGEIYGDVVPGFFEWAFRAIKHFQLVVYSSRSKDPVMLYVMQTWLEHRLAHWLNHADLDVAQAQGFFTFSADKPAAWATIDDRGITFRGDWTAAELQPEALLAFRPWNVNG